MLDFNNTEIAFLSKSNSDLRNAYLLYSTIASPALVKGAKGISEFALRMGVPVGWAVKPTLYRQFVGGETLEECTKTVELLSRENVKSVLDYSAEGGKELGDVERAYQETIRSIDYAKGNQNIAYTVFKPTAMVVGSVLEKASEGSALNDIEKTEMENFRTRIFSLCRRAYENGVRILIDAEHYATQEIIDKITEEAMEMFNKERVIVFHTLQMYRHDRIAYLKYLHQESKGKNYKPGIKFVRGAYMEEERERAIVHGYLSPIHATKTDTDRSYDDGLRYVIDNIDDFELFSGTHNYESNYLLAGLIQEKGLTKNDPRIFFSQLFGMSDNISFALAREGYNICKYIPYAPVKDVLPYLLRRAEENTSMAGQTGRELSLIKAEMNRRNMRLI
jgi:proline dehydrogenase